MPIFLNKTTLDLRLSGTEAVLTFTSPLIKTGSTITFNSAGYVSSSQLTQALTAKQDDLINIFCKSSTQAIGIGNVSPIALLTVGNSFLVGSDGSLILAKCSAAGTSRH